VTDNHRNGFLGAVGRFFFLPTDPSTLGLIRIMTGVLLLYVHAAYSLDLKALVGPHAWWDHQAANVQRREAPTIPTPFGWSTFEPTLYLDDAPHRRTAMLDYLRNLPLDPAQRKAKLRYLDRIFFLTPADIRDGFNLSFSAGLLVDREDQEAQVRAALQAAVVPESGSPVTIPDFIRQLTPDQRIVVWEDVLVFNSTLPDNTEGREYVLAWLRNYPHNRRLKLYQFLVGERMEGGKDFSLPTDSRERAEFLDFADRWGSDTRQASAKGVAKSSQWYHITDSTTMWVVHIAILCVFFLFTIGLWTRVVSVLAWALALSYIQRGEISLFGQDTMQSILMTYLMIGPSGAAFSIDALRKRFRASRGFMAAGGRSVPWAEAVLAGPQRLWLANTAIRLLQINFCLVYASSGISKLKGTSWWEHSAAWLILSNPEFGLVRYPAFEWLLRQLAESRFILSIFASLITLFTLVVELGLPVLIWTRLRPFFVIGSILLHLGIAIMMGLNVFSLYMFAFVLCYFPAKLIRDRVGYSPGQGKKMTVHYDSRSRQAVRKSSLIRALDVASQITFVDTHGKGSVDATVRLTGPDGKNLTGYDLYSTALRELVLLKPIRLLGYIPGVWEMVALIFGGEYPVSVICPSCKSTDFTTRRPKHLIAFAKDRVCKSCQTRYVPPTPIWGSLAILGVGLLLTVFGCLFVMVRLQTWHWRLVGIPALIVEAIVAYVGIYCILRGIQLSVQSLVRTKT